MSGFFLRTPGFDPGWLFVLSGLVICSAALLVPAHMDLEASRHQLSALQSQEHWAVERLTAYDRFMEQLDSEDPGLMKRLASRSLNMLPEGDIPVLMDIGASESSIEQWIDSTVSSSSKEEHSKQLSMLAVISTGPYRPWFLAGGVACIFVGLLTSITSNPGDPQRETSLS